MTVPLKLFNNSQKIDRRMSDEKKDRRTQIKSSIFFRVCKTWKERKDPREKKQMNIQKKKEKKL